MLKELSHMQDVQEHGSCLLALLSQYGDFGRRYVSTLSKTWSTRASSTMSEYDGKS